MSDLADTVPYRLGGGLNLVDAPEEIAQDEALELQNFRFVGGGRWTIRRAARALASSFSNVCGAHAMPHGKDNGGSGPNGAVVLDYDGGRVKLYALDSRGENPALVGTLAGWSNVSSRPKTIACTLRSCMFIVDESRKYGLTVYDPYDVFETGQKLFQPKFKFDLDDLAEPGPIFARAVHSWNNFLFVAGYGTEADQDRPELVRFSYLGLEADVNGAGDAGVVDAPTPLIEGYYDAEEHGPGSRGMFDLEDYFMVGERGAPVIGMQGAGERMLINNKFGAYILFGYDRDSFFLDLIDNQRGLVAGRAIGEADGIAYWYSPLGPARWGGGRPETISRKIHEALSDIDSDTVFFAHQRSENEVRWYYSDDGADPKKYVAYNYLFDKWHIDESGVRLFCAGTVRPGTEFTPGLGGVGPVPDEPPPTGNPPEQDPEDDSPTIPKPENLRCVKQTNPNVIVVNWDPAITTTGAYTRWQIREEDGGSYGTISAVDAGTGGLISFGRSPDTEYRIKIWHSDGSKNSQAVEITCRTAAGDPGDYPPPPPKEFEAEGGTFVWPDDPGVPNAGDTESVITFRWKNATTGVVTQIHLHGPYSSAEMDPFESVPNSVHESDVDESQVTVRDVEVGWYKAEAMHIWDDAGFGAPTSEFTDTISFEVSGEVLN